MKYCKHCGAKLEDDAMFCEECGQKVGLKTQKKEDTVNKTKTIEINENTLPDKTTKKNVVPILCGLISALIIIIVVMVIFLMNDSEKNSTNGNNLTNSSDTVSIEKTSSDITENATGTQNITQKDEKETDKPIQEVTSEASSEEKTSEPQTESNTDKIKKAIIGTWSCEFITQNGYTYNTEIEFDNTQGEIAVSEIVFRCNKQNSDSGFVDKLVDIPVTVYSNGNVEFDVSEAKHCYTKSTDPGVSQGYKLDDELKDKYIGTFTIMAATYNGDLTVTLGKIHCGSLQMDFTGANLGKK